MTLFNTPILTPLLRLIFWPILWVSGWRCPNPVPSALKKCVIVVAPHTSNWDFALFVMVLFVYRMQMNVMIKHTLFVGPLGWFLRYCGSIAIDRRQVGARVREMSKMFKTRERFNLLITLEGTRSARTHWKTGFYQIALAANVPIVVAYLDAKKKEVSVAYQCHPEEGKLDEAMQKLYDLYDQCEGLRPENYASPNRPGPDVKSPDVTGSTG